MANSRSCIVSRQPMDKEALLRFVAGPDGSIYPDLKESLPGRGVWVEARRESVEQAVAKNLFARSLKTQVSADSNLADTVGQLLGERAIKALALARKAGTLVTGFTKADTAIRSNQARMLFHGSDATADGRRKLAQAITFAREMGGEEVEVFDCWTSAEMGAALGLEAATHAVALEGGATTALKRSVERWLAYEGKLTGS
ncbi:RNA-binding protein [Salaquimonas pukyongi]|uniref:RNA-binding protein n=1 Tax=Salaquimonas pukyongi TaxID=2712698 RepID=UPI00096B7A7F|nr:RNA-binding protein [Salaquimonas pukyongi]